MGAWIETQTTIVKGEEAESHPVWVRGLKQSFLDQLVVLGLRSHPVWVRGLKHNNIPKTEASYRSHPVWVRGLKHIKKFKSTTYDKVAPRVGAWIET